MRRKVTINVDEDWLKFIDSTRGLIPRSRYIEMIARDLGSRIAPAEDERSPEPRTEFQAATDEILNDLHSGPITEQLETPRAKPPLQRPIIQKRGT